MVWGHVETRKNKNIQIVLLRIQVCDGLAESALVCSALKWMKRAIQIELCSNENIVRKINKGRNTTLENHFFYRKTLVFEHQQAFLAAFIYRF